MGKKLKNYAVSKSTKRGRKSNSDKNLRKKKKVRVKDKKIEKTNNRDMKHKLDKICDDFKKIGSISTTQAIVRQKLRRDEKKMKLDLKSICKDMERVLDTKDDNEEGTEEVAVVEDLACQVSDLMITPDQLSRSGFVYTRWQQRKFLEGLKLVKLRKQRREDICCETPNLCPMHSQNLQEEQI